jgi:hypothetical protein
MYTNNIISVQAAKMLWQIVAIVRGAASFTCLLNNLFIFEDSISKMENLRKFENFFHFSSQLRKNLEFFKKNFGNFLIINSAFPKII